MTLRTLTFDPAIYKLMPVNPTDEMVVSAREKIGVGSNVAHHTYLVMASAVPDTLPGVILLSEVENG